MPSSSQDTSNSTATPRASPDACTEWCLKTLNDATKNFATWKVCVDQARIVDYTWDNGTKSGKLFKCILVCTLDNTYYVNAEIRKTKGCPSDFLDKALKLYQNGFLFKISKVGLRVSPPPGNLASLEAPQKAYILGGGESLTPPGTPQEG